MIDVNPATTFNRFFIDNDFSPSIYNRRTLAQPENLIDINDDVRTNDHGNEDSIQNLQLQINELKKQLDIETSMRVIENQN
jgi:hypothetical protein